MPSSPPECSMSRVFVPRISAGAVNTTMRRLSVVPGSSFVWPEVSRIRSCPLLSISRNVASCVESSTLETVKFRFIMSSAESGAPRDGAADRADRRTAAATANDLLCNCIFHPFRCVGGAEDECRPQAEEQRSEEGQRRQRAHEHCHRNQKPHPQVQVKVPGQQQHAKAAGNRGAHEQRSLAGRQESDFFRLCLIVMVAQFLAQAEA